jgi:hypothetical protein
MVGEQTGPGRKAMQNNSFCLLRQFIDVHCLHTTSAAQFSFYSLKALGGPHWWQLHTIKPCWAFPKDLSPETDRKAIRLSSLVYCF